MLRHQDLRTGNGKSNHREASALGGFPDLKQLARRRGHGEIGV
ncbi:hypothetical protein [Dendronalium sp. ChiSLP03b]